jgi:hypothetical protein
MDYEFQPANHIGFRLARRIVVPSAFPRSRLRVYGARSTNRVSRFDGYKEELYLDQVAASADDGWSTIGEPSRMRCLFRPPPHGALYHREGNTHFETLLRQVASRRDANVLVLPRFPAQRSQYASIPRVHVADRTVDGLAALRTADVFIGAGGTMCREAALLGVPAYTVFAGRMASVDRELIKAGMLHDLRTAEVDVEKWTRRDLNTIRRDEAHLQIRARELRSWLSALIEEVAG